MPTKKPLPPLRPKQKKFADEYLRTWNWTKSALATYNTTDYNTAHAIASENLQKPTIREYIESISADAMKRINKLSIEAKNENVRYTANKDIVDRAGYKPTEKTESKVVIEDKQLTPEQKILIAQQILANTQQWTRS